MQVHSYVWGASLPFTLGLIQQAGGFPQERITREFAHLDRSGNKVHMPYFGL